MEKVTIIDQFDEEDSIVGYAWVCRPCNYIYYEETDITEVPITP